MDTAYGEALNGDRQKKVLMRIKRKTLVDEITLLADYVQTASGRDETKIVSSGYDITSRGVITEIVLPQPVNVRVKAAIFENELEIK